MTTQKRTKVIHIRLTEDEHQAMLERKTKARLAEWIRELALSQKPKRQPKPIDPVLLLELNRIGVNLNQIARQLNSLPIKDQLSIAISLKNIDNELHALRSNLL